VLLSLHLEVEYFGLQENLRLLVAVVLLVELEHLFPTEFLFGGEVGQEESDGV